MDDATNHHFTSGIPGTTQVQTISRNLNTSGKYILSPTNRENMVTVTQGKYFCCLHSVNTEVIVEFVVFVRLAAPKENPVIIKI